MMTRDIQGENILKVHYDINVTDVLINMINSFSNMINGSKPVNHYLYRPNEKTYSVSNSVCIISN
jgi:hypothetical protein